ncbi:MAG: DegT/DnrJ/EryC1/StrS family aminotransferase [archaeon]
MQMFEKQEKKLIERLKKLTKHDYVKFTDRGNSAIFIALSIAKKVNPRPHLLIPDQGGWISYKRYPLFFNYNIQEVKTDNGIIDLKDLKKKSKNASALIITSFAGYFAEQPLRRIATVCKKNGCLLIEDASGAIGDTKLCNGKHSDIIVGSFGKWKPINYGYGGFISVKEPSYFSEAKETLSMIKVHPQMYKDLPKYLKKTRYKKLLKLAEKVKKDLPKDVKIYHKDKRGLNVITEFKPKVINFCEKNNYPYLLCPNYIRINEKTISIELKRLDL